MNLENLSHNIRLLLAERKIKATDLSLELNFSQNRINDILRGVRTIRITNEEVESIAKSLEVTVDKLLHKKAYLEFK